MLIGRTRKRILEVVAFTPRVGPVVRARVRDQQQEASEVYVLRDSIAGRRLLQARNTPVELETRQEADGREWVQFVREVHVWPL